MRGPRSQSCCGGLWRRRRAVSTPEGEAGEGAGLVNLRFQPDPNDYSNFIDIKAAAKVH